MARSIHPILVYHFASTVTIMKHAWAKKESKARAAGLDTDASAGVGHEEVEVAFQPSFT